VNKFIGKFSEMDYFEADEGNEDAPTVEFDFGK
jgi:LemA protein